MSANAWQEWIMKSNALVAEQAAGTSHTQSERHLRVALASSACCQPRCYTMCTVACTCCTIQHARVCETQTRQSFCTRERCSVSLMSHGRHTEAASGPGQPVQFRVAGVSQRTASCGSPCTRSSCARSRSECVRTVVMHLDQPYSGLECAQQGQVHQWPDQVCKLLPPCAAPCAGSSGQARSACADDGVQICHACGASTRL